MKIKNDKYNYITINLNVINDLFEIYAINENNKNKYKKIFNLKNIKEIICFNKCKNYNECFEKFNELNKNDLIEIKENNLYLTLKINDFLGSFITLSLIDRNEKNLIKKEINYFNLNKLNNFESKNINLKYLNSIKNSQKINQSNFDFHFDVFKSIKNKYLLLYKNCNSLILYDIINNKEVNKFDFIKSLKYFNHYFLNNKDYILILTIDSKINLININENENLLINNKKNYFIKCCDIIENKNILIYYCTYNNEKYYIEIYNLISNQVILTINLNLNDIFIIKSYYYLKHYYIIIAGLFNLYSYEYESFKFINLYKSKNKKKNFCLELTELDNKLLIIVSYGNSINIFNFFSGELINTIYSMGLYENLLGICLLNNKYLFSGGEDDRIHLFDLKNGNHIKEFIYHFDVVCYVKKIYINELGDCLISYSKDNNIKLFKIINY